MADAFIQAATSVALGAGSLTLAFATAVLGNAAIQLSAVSSPAGACTAAAIGLMTASASAIAGYAAYDIAKDMAP